MPRGVYARKSAPSAGALKKAKPKAKAKPALKKAKKAAPKAVPKSAAKKGAGTSPPPVQLVSPAFLVEPGFFKNKRVDVNSIAGDELKGYARFLGITQRDVDGLTEDRLRQNCKARIADTSED